MSLSARVPAGADTYKYVPEIFLNLVIEAAKSKLVAWDALNTQWTSGMVKGDTFYFPKSNAVTATEVVVGTKGSALDPFATAAVTLTVNQWYEAPVDIDYMTKLQTQAQMEQSAVAEAAYAIAKKMDTTANTLYSALGGSAYPNADTGDALTDDILLALKLALDEADVPMDGNRSLIVDPSGLSDMLKIDKLVAATYSAAGGNIKNGIIGQSVYGCTVRVTNNLTAASTGAYGAMIHKNAIAGLAQIEKAWRKEFEELHQTRFQSEALWGVVEVQDTFGKAFFTRHA